MYTHGDYCTETGTYRETSVTFKCLENADGVSMSEVRYQYDEPFTCQCKSIYIILVLVLYIWYLIYFINI
jgi:hypothetical protein